MKSSSRWLGFLLLFLTLLFKTDLSFAQTFYVRPADSCPTNGDGTSYSCASREGGKGAWNRFSNILWGAGSGHVGPGDTLYVCGTHDEQLLVGADGTKANPMIIRGDYPEAPGRIRCPTTTINREWSEFPDSNIFYQTITNPNWVGQVFIRKLRHDRAMMCDRARIRIGVPEYSDFRAYTGRESADFVGYQEHPGKGSIQADGSTWLAATNELSKWQVSCKLSKRSDGKTYIMKRMQLAPNTIYVLSYGGKSGGTGSGMLQLKCKVGETVHFLQDNCRKGIYGSWSPQQNLITSTKNEGACITTSDTSWTRKRLIFKTHPVHGGAYFLYLGPEGNNVDGKGYVHIDDLTVYTVSHLPPNAFTALSEIHGDSGSRSMDVTLFVHMPDGKMPNKGELLYQDTRQAVNLDNVNHAEIHHMEIWGSIGGDLTKNGRFYATVKDCTLYYAGGAMQGPNGRTGKKSSRWTGAVAFVADKDRAYREVIITDCTIRKSLGGGILIRRCHSGRAAGNTITNFVCGNAPWPGAFYGTLANNFIVEKNLCDTSGHRGIHTKGQWGISGIWFDGNSNRDIIRYNWVRNVNGSYYNCESSDNGEWYYNIGSHGARFGYKLGGGREAHGNRILNNTLIHTQSVIDETGRRRTGGGILLYDQDQGKTVVKNNIIHTSTGYYIYVHPEFGGAGLTIDYNNYSGLPKSRWHWKGRDYFVFSSWQTAGNNGNDMHGPGVANPFFSSISERGVELLPQSPCIDVGGDVGLRTDFRGTAVPQGKGIEIGSNEYLQAP